MISIIIGAENYEIKEVDTDFLKMLSVTKCILDADPDIKSIHLKSDQKVSETEFKIISGFLKSNLWDLHEFIEGCTKNELIILFYWILYIGFESKSDYDKYIKIMIENHLDCTDDPIIDKAIAEFI
jgi:hypothetical protein